MIRLVSRCSCVVVTTLWPKLVEARLLHPQSLSRRGLSPVRRDCHLRRAGTLTLDVGGDAAIDPLL